MFVGITAVQRKQKINHLSKLTKKVFNSSQQLSSKYKSFGFLVSRETVVLRWWESETKVEFYQTS